MLTTIALVFLGLFTASIHAAGHSDSDPSDRIPSGYWLIKDDDTGQVRSEVQFYLKGENLHARITGLKEGEEKARCSDCPGEFENRELKGMDLIWGLEWDGSRWSGGSILDVDDGKIYSCRINSFDEETVEVRGYISRPILGRTVTWYRK